MAPLKNKKDLAWWGKKKKLELVSRWALFKKNYFITKRHSL